ncbi:DUF222 domain-containing protein [Gordonia sp. zg691]|uniref:HNH endonuclease signature motif containing protein n=1 Tax=Gordonia jinghuaiqii TaxID=2758710 RepID=UPI001662421B|nr:DUF222 domain-containing protein [Gordonia jinghuaiqii]
MTTHMESADAASLPEAVRLADELDRLLDEMQAANLAECSDAQLVDVAVRTERAIARLNHAGDRQIVESVERDLPRKTGHRSVTAFMAHRLRITDPGRRNRQRAATATYSSPTGEPLEPEYPGLAAEFAAGRVGAGHVRAVIDVLEQIPPATDHDVKVAAERQMAEIAVDHTPDDIAALGARLLGYLDPDGTLADETERKRKRALWINRQHADGTAKLTAVLTAEMAALLKMLLAGGARAGMNNPDDPTSPQGLAEDADPDAVTAAAERDDRTPAQMNHDALHAALASMFASGVLGSTHRGLPMTLIVKADLGDLQRGTGMATTVTGTLLPIPDLINMAADIQPYLAVFKDATAVPLYFGTGKRFATRGQRLASFARPDGEVCSAPGCDQPAAQVEIHHAEQDWALGGLTDITDLAPACGRHNRMVGDRPGQYTTRMEREGPEEGRCVWRLNAEPGAPPNPERVNRRPDIPHRFAAHLYDVRHEIHGPDTSDDPACLSSRVVIDHRPAAGFSRVEARLAALLSAN